MFRELSTWIKDLFTTISSATEGRVQIVHGIDLNLESESGRCGGSGARGKVERAKCAEVQTVLAERGKEHRA
jgi:hypothetical protein